MHSIRAYLGIASSASARRPLLGSLLGRVPDSILSVSLVLLVHSRTGSYGRAGLAAAGFAIGSAMSAPVAGRALDRFGQRRLLTAMAVVFATAVVAIVLGGGATPEPVTIAIAIAAGLSRPPLDAALRALWPRLVRTEAVQTAYSLDAILQELIWIAGPLLLAVLLVVDGPALPLLACAGLALAGTLLYSSSPAASAAPAARSNRIRGGLRESRFACLLCAATLYGVAVGILSVTLTAFCVAHGARSALGMLIAVWGIGSIVGGLAYGTRRWKVPAERRAILLLGALALLLAALATARSVTILALLMFALGLPLSPWLGTLNVATQASIPATRITEAFTWSFALITIGTAAGNAAAGPIVQHAVVAAGFLSAAAAAAAGAVLGGLGLAIRSRTSGLGGAAESVRDVAGVPRPLDAAAHAQVAAERDMQAAQEARRG